MVKFEGFDKRGEVIFSKCTTHYYHDLPMKGLGKSMDGVGIDEPVIIPQSVGIDLTDLTIWGFTKAEILRRAKELGADVKFKEMVDENPNDGTKTQMWFCNGRQRREQRLTKIREGVNLKTINH